MVNIENIKDISGVSIDDTPTEEYKLEAIFKKQKELIERYHPIEVKSGLRLTGDCPVNLNDAKGQMVLKDYAQRFLEEIGEALEAYNLHRDNPVHMLEEISDALHFLTELTIHAGYGPDFFLTQDKYKLEKLFYDAEELIGSDENLPMNYRLTFRHRTYGNLLIASGITLEAMGKTCNCLRQKPWKQSQVLTDISKFQKCLYDTWLRFIGLCITAGITEDMLFKLYLDKNSVNQFRIRSNY